VDDQRYRCSACGNLTRFDVVERSRTRSFHHFTVGGELQVEEQEILEHVVEEVSCRWCGNGRSVQPVSGVQEETAVTAAETPELDDVR
jgi:hypothetical protein